MTRFHRIKNSMAAMTLCAFPVLPAYAQSSMDRASAEDQSAGAEEIVVTARRREENLQDTPISITAFSSAALERRGIQNLTDVASYVPNMLATPGTVSKDDGNYYIRGIGQRDAYSNVEPGVGTYIDGVYLGRTAGAALDLIRIARVEVLRGPQGTLFGRNTIGGAVSIVTQRPGTEFGGQVSLLYGERDRMQVRGAIDLPLSGTELTSSLAFLMDRQDGYMRTNIPGERANANDTRALMARLRYEAGHAAFDLTFDLTDRDGTGACNRALFINTALAYIPPEAVQSVSSDRYRCFTSQPTLAQELRTWGLNGTFEMDLGSVTLKSITAYRELSQDLRTDQDGTAINLFDLDIGKRQNQVSQELQLTGTGFGGRLNWLLGAYYFRERIRERQRLRFAPLGATFFRLRDFAPATDSYAIFTQGTLVITDQLSITAGVRMTFEDKSMPTNNSNENGGVVTPAVQSTPQESWTATTPKIGIEYSPNRDLLFYASYSEGFRSGGFNARAGNNAQAIPFDPERNKVWELGLKSEFWNRRVRFNLAGWYSDYRDIQILTISGGFASNRNAGNAELYGFEAELSVTPVPGLTLNAGAGYTYSRYTRIRSDAPTILITDPLPYVPRWTVNGGVQYEVVLANEGYIRFRGDISYTSEVPFAPPSEPQPGYTLVNGRIAWAPSPQIEFNVYGRNIFNQYYAVYRQRDVGAGFYNEFVAPPRELGVGLSLRF